MTDVQEEESRTGLLVSLMDRVLEGEQKGVVEPITRILTFSLQVSKVCSNEDEADIVLGKPILGSLHRSSYSYSETYFGFN